MYLDEPFKGKGVFINMKARALLYILPPLIFSIPLSEGTLYSMLQLLVGGLVFWIPYWVALFLSGYKVKPGVSYDTEDEQSINTYYPIVPSSPENFLQANTVNDYACKPIVPLSMDYSCHDIHATNNRTIGPMSDASFVTVNTACGRMYIPLDR